MGNEQSKTSALKRDDGSETSALEDAVSASKRRDDLDFAENDAVDESLAFETDHSVFSSQVPRSTAPGLPPLARRSPPDFDIPSLTSPIAGARSEQGEEPSVQSAGKPKKDKSRSKENLHSPSVSLKAGDAIEEDSRVSAGNLHAAESHAARDIQADEELSPEALRRRAKKEKKERKRAARAAAAAALAASKLNPLQNGPEHQQSNPEASTEGHVAQTKVDDAGTVEEPVSAAVSPMVKRERNSRLLSDQGAYSPADEQPELQPPADSLLLSSDAPSRVFNSLAPGREEEMSATASSPLKRKTMVQASDSNSSKRRKLVTKGDGADGNEAKARENRLGHPTSESRANGTLDVGNGDSAVQDEGLNQGMFQAERESNSWEADEDRNPDDAIMEIDVPLRQDNTLRTTEERGGKANQFDGPATTPRADSTRQRSKQSNTGSGRKRIAKPSFFDTILNNNADGTPPTTTGATGSVTDSAARPRRTPRLTNKVQAVASSSKAAERNSEKKKQPKISAMMGGADPLTPRNSSQAAQTASSKRKSGKSADKILRARDEYLKGPFSQSEISALTAAVETWRDANRMTDYEVNELIKAAPNKAHSHELWSHLCASCPLRPRQKVINLCRKRFHNYVARGSWTQEQHNELVSLYELHGGKYALIGEIINRHPEDVRDRIRNYVVCGDSQRKTHWTPQEEERFTEIIRVSLDQIARNRASGDPGTLSASRDDELIDWGMVSAQMDRTRSRLQCQMKWKKIRGAVMGEIDIHGASGQTVADLIDQARAEFENMDGHDLHNIVHGLRAAVLKDKHIAWGKLHKSKHGRKWSRPALVLAWYRLMGAVPRSEEQTLTENLDWLLQHFEEDVELPVKRGHEVSPDAERAFVEQHLKKFLKNKKKHSERFVHMSDDESPEREDGMDEEDAPEEVGAESASNKHLPGFEAMEPEPNGDMDMDDTNSEGVDEDEPLSDYEADEQNASDDMDMEDQPRQPFSEAKGPANDGHPPGDSTMLSSTSAKNKGHRKATRLSTPIESYESDDLAARDEFPLRTPPPKASATKRRKRRTAEPEPLDNFREEVDSSSQEQDVQAVSTALTSSRRKRRKQAGENLSSVKRPQGRTVAEKPGDLDPFRPPQKSASTKGKGKEKSTAFVSVNKPSEYADDLDSELQVWQFASPRKKGKASSERPAPLEESRVESDLPPAEDSPSDDNQEAELTEEENEVDLPEVQGPDNRSDEDYNPQAASRLHRQDVYETPRANRTSKTPNTLSGPVFQPASLANSRKSKGKEKHVVASPKPAFVSTPEARQELRGHERNDDETAVTSGTDAEDIEDIPSSRVRMF